MRNKSSNKVKGKNTKKRHRFFLNPYSDCGFTKCPKCETKTKVRKFPLVIHVEPQQLFLLNKKCKYCPSCDLIIVKKQELESLMTTGMIQSNPEVIGNDYLVMGTVDRKDWIEGTKNSLPPSEIIKCMYLFRDIWDFEVIPAGWYPAEDK